MPTRPLPTLGLFFLLSSLAAPLAAGAQTPLTLAAAMDRARTLTPQARALEATAGESEQRVRRARAGYFPVVDFTESIERGNQPVFVFSALLSQRRFSEGNFAISSLNQPDPVTNTRTTVRVEQPVFDAGMTRYAVRGAALEREALAASRAASTQDLAFAAARAFVRVLQQEAALRASDAAVEAAESDLARARARREVGVATDADLLAVDVHLAAMRQRRIASLGELDVARLELSEATGSQPGEIHALAPPDLPGETPGIDALVATALASRPELRAAGLRADLAQNARRLAQAAYLPRLGVLGGFEWNGSSLANQRSSWVVGAQVQVNLFRGFADRARAAEAAQAELRARAEREQMERRVIVEVRSAAVRLESARARRAAGEAALAQARESHRIIRDRYDSGLATIADVLRAAEATLDAESFATSAVTDLVLQSLALERALGRL